ncbi:hypothetical protein FDT80_18250 [Sulfitobacter sabulilitoris]|uniref:Uncharacterized protein n=1 Tax=Sulfitobacter sabulilitoris TaxID=2562655 RepID=A0A5S3P859_9RHOB|nr:hypothetical protein FDT80_18250 [Sulfitobacter sabulilitoris]
MTKIGRFNLAVPLRKALCCKVPPFFAPINPFGAFSPYPCIPVSVVGNFQAVGPTRIRACATAAYCAPKMAARGATGHQALQIEALSAIADMVYSGQGMTQLYSALQASHTF